MPESVFTELQEAFPLASDRVPYDPAIHDSFAAQVPDELAAEWRNFGFGAYGDGILWLTPPQERLLDPAEWPKVDPSAIEVLRTAFGDVCLWQDGTFQWFSILRNDLARFLPEARTFFLGLTDEGFRKYLLREKIFRAGLKKFGSPSVQECYGFAPLPSLGGAIAEKYLIKTELRPYLSLVAQSR